MIPVGLHGMYLTLFNELMHQFVQLATGGPPVYYDAPTSPLGALRERDQRNDSQ